VLPENAVNPSLTAGLRVDDKLCAINDVRFEGDPGAMVTALKGGKEGTMVKITVSRFVR
jgi:C-terminal processing protease CtpA/Prc